MLRLACLMAAVVAVTADDLLARFTPRIHTADDGGTLPYRWYQPNTATADNKVPLVILLHGTSGRGVDNERQFTAANRAAITFFFAQHEHPCAIAVPQCPTDDQWVRTDYHPDRHQRPDLPGRTMALLDGLIHNRMFNETAVDSTRVYVIGNSMGGYGTWDLISRVRQIAAAVPICGGGDLEGSIRGIHIPTWVFHGAQDPIVSVEHSRRMVAFIRNLEVDIRYTEFPDAGHDIAERVFSTPGLAQWLFAQQRP